MQIQNLYPGGIASNCYLVSEGTDAVLIDCSAPVNAVKAALARVGATLRGVILTHGHYDHLMTQDEIKAEFGVKVWLHRADEKFPETGLYNCYHVFTGFEASFTPPDELFEDGEVLEFGALTIKAINTPGHTPGCSVLQTGNALFTGDTLMSCGYGRTTFPGGNTPAMRDSLQRLFSLPQHLFIYPGHGDGCSLGTALHNIFG